jgi:hypothetical protein
MELFRYILPHALAGGAAGALAAVVLVATNAQLNDLMRHTDGGWMAFCLLVGGCVLTFAPAAAGHAIMMIQQNKDH